MSGSSPKRRRAEEKDEGIGSPDILEEEKTEDLRREMIELRQQLEKERSVRMMLEDQVRIGNNTKHVCHVMCNSNSDAGGNKHSTLENQLPPTATHSSCL